MSGMKIGPLTSPLEHLANKTINSLIIHSMVSCPTVAYGMTQAEVRVLISCIFSIATYGCKSFTTPSP